MRTSVTGAQSFSGARYIARRAALSAPDGFSCARCKQLAFARSRLTYLKKKKSGVSAYLKWLPYAALCALRNLRGGT